MTMPASSEQLLNVVRKLASPGTPGRTEAIRRANPGPGLSSSSLDLTPSQRAFLDAADRVQRAPRTPTYVHPAMTAQQKTPRSEGPLTAAELAWLDRLPADPRKVPFADAERLFTLRDSVPKGSTDAALVESHLAGVRDFHDTEQAKVDLEAASAPLPATPHQALPAIADAIAAENPELEPDEAIGRASAALAEAGVKIRAARADKAQIAQDRIAEIRNRGDARAAVHR